MPCAPGKAKGKGQKDWCCACGLYECGLCNLKKGDVSLPKLINLHKISRRIGLVKKKQTIWRTLHEILTMLWGLNENR